MSTADVLLRLAQSYGMLIGMGLGLMVVVAVVVIVIWRREIRWRDVILGLGGMALIGFSVWIAHDLDVANRRTLQPKIDEWMKRLTYTANRHHRILSQSICQPEKDAKITELDVHNLAGEAYNIVILVGAIKEELGSLLPSYYESKD
jgi:hypothetical protein